MFITKGFRWSPEVRYNHVYYRYVIIIEIIKRKSTQCQILQLIDTSVLLLICPNYCLTSQYAATLNVHNHVHWKRFADFGWFIILWTMHHMQELLSLKLKTYSIERLLAYSSPWRYQHPCPNKHRPLPSSEGI